MPVLANITEFGKTPLFTVEQLRGAGVAMVLYPLSAFRAMNAAAVATSIARSARTARSARSSSGCRRAKNFTKSSNYHAAEQQLDRLTKLMSEAKKKIALSGVVAGETAICTVGKEGVGLTYRGYSIEDLAAHASYEETAWLVLHGELPTRAQLDEFRAKLATLRGLPPLLRQALELLPADAHPMDVLRTGCSVLGTLEPEGPRARRHGHRLAAARHLSRRCCSTGITSRDAARASKPRRTSPASPRISSTCSTARRRRRSTRARWTSR